MVTPGTVVNAPVTGTALPTGLHVSLLVIPTDRSAAGTILSRVPDAQWSQMAFPHCTSWKIKKELAAWENVAVTFWCITITYPYAMPHANLPGSKSFKMPDHQA